MPQLIALVVVGAGLIAGYRWLSREQKRVAAAIRQAEEAILRRQAEQGVGKGDLADQGNDGSIKRLEQDPETGEYRPVN